MSKTQIKNLSNSDITIILPAVRFQRTVKPNQVVPVADDVAEEMNYDDGCRSFIQDGFLTIITEDEDLKSRIPVVEAKTSEDVDIDDLLKNQPIKELSKVLKNATPALKDKIVERAIQLSIADGPHCNIIKQFTGVDVLKVLNLQHE